MSIALDSESPSLVPDTPWSLTTRRPTWFVLAALNGGPFAAPDWTELTGLTKSLSTFRGRQQELDVFQPGTCGLVVDGSSRSLDPTNTAGPHHGRLLPNRQLRISAAFGASGLRTYGRTAAQRALISCTVVDYPEQPIDASNGVEAWVDVTCDDWSPAWPQAFAAQAADLDPYGWSFGLEAATGKLTFSWSPTGLISGAIAQVSSVATGFVDGSRHAIGVRFVPDNGSGSYELSFWESTSDGGSVSQIGSTLTGTASAPTDTGQAVTIGGLQIGYSQDAIFHSATILDEPLGAIWASPRFSNGAYFIPGATNGYDPQGKRWKLSGSCSLPVSIFDVWKGYVEGWPVPSTADLTRVPIDAVDGFGLLSEVELPEVSPLVSTLVALGPVHWWRLNEPADSGSLADSGSQPIAGAPNTGASGGLGSTGLDAGSSETALVNPSGGYVLVSPGHSFISAAVIVERAAMGTADEYLYNECTNDWAVVVKGSASGATGRLEVSDATGKTSTSSATIDDGLPHLIVFVRTAPGVFSIYIDGTSVAVTTGGGVVIGSGTDATIGSRATTPGLNSFTGTIQHFATWSRQLSAAEVAALTEGYSAWSGDSIDDRIGRFLNLAGWPQADRALDASDIAPIGPFVPAEGDVLSEIRALERSEFGAFYQTAAGKMRFRSRYATVTDPRSTECRYTFTDEAGRGLFRFSEIELAPQLEWVRNRVTVSYVGGSVTVEDRTSIIDHGIRTFTIDTVLPNSVRAQTLGQLILQRYAQPIDRIASLVLNPGAQPMLWEPILGLELGDRVRVVWTPGGTGSSITVEATVDSITIDAGAIRTGEAGRAELRLASADLVSSGPAEGYVPPISDSWQWDVTLWGTTAIWV